MENLFNKNITFHDDVFRNIVSLRESEDLYDDINDEDESVSLIGVAVEANVKKNLPKGLINRGFHYTHSISYPFETEPFMSSRYGDGKFGVWYGSLDLQTTIYETVHHMMKDESIIEGLNEVIIRERVVYKIYCEAILIDLSEKHTDYPQLISENYEFTQQIGQKLYREGHPGLLAPSARTEGTNTVIFNPSVLDNPRNYCYLTYRFDPKSKKVIVERAPGKILMTLSREQLIRDAAMIGSTGE